ncbi:MAG: hypothetical protein IPJ65_43715 [Archangiaceae bacterium]|nr:hypothetical protein [Archangiaceae bacterium]
MDDAAAARLRLSAAWALAVAGYALAFLVSSVVPTPLVWYFPLERRFSFEVRPSALAMDFYGRVLLSVLSGAVVFALARLALRRTGPEASRQWVRRALAWSAALLVFSAGLYAFVLWHRAVTPAPLPEGYVPR